MESLFGSFYVNFVYIFYVLYWIAFFIFRVGGGLCWVWFRYGGGDRVESGSGGYRVIVFL